MSSQSTARPVLEIHPNQRKRNRKEKQCSWNKMCHFKMLYPKFRHQTYDPLATPLHIYPSWYYALKLYCNSTTKLQQLQASYFITVLQKTWFTYYPLNNQMKKKIKLPCIFKSCLHMLVLKKHDSSEKGLQELIAQILKWTYSLECRKFCFPDRK